MEVVCHQYISVQPDPEPFHRFCHLNRLIGHDKSSKLLQDDEVMLFRTKLTSPVSRI